MTKENLKNLIKQLKAGDLSEDAFSTLIDCSPYKKIGNIKIDFQRKVRRGLPEVVYGRGKDINQLSTIIATYIDTDEDILITKVDKTKYNKLKSIFNNIMFYEKAEIITFDKESKERFKGKILIISAGASDESIAEEAYVSAKYLGNNVIKEYDVGIACISRILDLREKFNESTVIIAIAGMEGAMPSVVAGLTSTPIIAVPTSIGYGANFNGIASLLSMLNSCSGGISVVNIDNGFGAAYQATLINQKISKKI